MNSRLAFKGCLVAALVTLGANLGWDRTVAAQQDQAGVEEEGIEVLTRGPVHEAFAETITFDPQPGIVVSNTPPDAIEELPPDQRPEGDHVTWIPGYWAWDDERDDFLWVSGIWRALPPGRQWVSGYWGESEEEFQWTSGYWADANLSENEYLPEPPATVEEGASSAAPSADHIWTPGCWVWNENRYAWRPGYWVEGQQDWVWVPAHYLWSPRGYVYVDGYYDYSVARRGVLFAPVYFDPNVTAQQGFTYSPAIVISTAVFGNQLFLRPNYGHYYFGDYYGSKYTTAGFTPWISFNSSGYGYDPFYAQQHWQNRENAGWAKTVQADFQHRVDHEEARPPHTLAAQQALVKSGDTDVAKNLILAASLAQLATSKDRSTRFQPVTKQEQQSLAKHGQAVNQFRTARQKLEAISAETSLDKPTKDSESAKVRLPKSPFLAKSADQFDKDHAPPKRHEAPAPDSKVEPKARRPTAKGELLKSKPTTIKAGKPELPQGKPREKMDKPKGAPKPVLKNEPKPTPKADPKPKQPKLEPKPAAPTVPKPNPQAGPKPERPKPAPRVEPKPEQPKVKQPGIKNKDQPKQ